MKVLCVSDDFLNKKAGYISASPEHSPKVGERLEATQCDVYASNYEFEKYKYHPSGREQSFNKKYFIPISNIDETEMERNYNELLTTK